MTTEEQLGEQLDQNFREGFENITDGNGNKCIKDGIVDINQYLKQDLKILWVLKEANSLDNCDWDMTDALRNDIKTENGLRYGWANTFTPIVYTTNGIFQNEDWDSMGDFTKDPNIIDCLQKVAYINLKKIPGGSVAFPGTIQEFYNENREAIHNQIEIINPNIVIFGATMGYIDYDFLENTFGKLEVNKENPHLHIYRNKEKLLLHAHHPNNRAIKHKEYCNFILDAVNDWKLNVRKVEN